MFSSACESNMLRKAASHPDTHSAHAIFNMFAVHTLHSQSVSLLRARLRFRNVHTGFGKCQNSPLYGKFCRQKSIQNTLVQNCIYTGTAQRDCPASSYINTFLGHCAIPKKEERSRMKNAWLFVQRGAYRQVHAHMYRERPISPHSKQNKTKKTQKKQPEAALQPSCANS